MSDAFDRPRLPVATALAFLEGWRGSGHPYRRRYVQMKEKLSKSSIQKVHICTGTLGN